MEPIRNRRSRRLAGGRAWAQTAEGLSELGGCENPARTQQEDEELLVPHTDIVEGPQPMNVVAQPEAETAAENQSVEGPQPMNVVAQPEAETAAENQSVEDPQTSRFTWTIEKFSRLTTKKHYSEIFTVGGYKWRVLIYPKGNNVDRLSLYLDVADSATLPYGWSRHARFSLSVVNQVYSKYSIRKDAQHQFNARESDWGFTSFMPLGELYDPSRGYIVNDTVIVEAENDLRENINSLVSSVNYRTKNKAPTPNTSPTKADGVTKSKLASKKKISSTNRPGKRATDGGDGDRGANPKHHRVYEEKRASVHLQLSGQDETPGSDGEEAQRVVVRAPIGNAADETLVDDRGEICTRMAQQRKQVTDASPSSERLHGDKASDAGVAVVPPSSSQTVRMTYQLVNVTLRNLMEAHHEEVKDVAACATNFLASLQQFGDGICVLQATIDAYVTSVAKFLAVQQDVTNKTAPHDSDISVAEDSLRSARVTYKGAVQYSQSLERREEVVAKAIEEAEVKLQVLHAEARSIKHQRSRQVEVISAAESNVGALQQKLDDLKNSRANSDDLVQAQSELDQCKKAIEAAMN